MSYIPLIDIASLHSGKPSAQTVAEFSRALNEIGFCYIKNHGISSDLQETLLTLFRDFFAQDLDKKMAIQMKNAGHAWRGYFPPSGELTSGKPDRKEGLYFGRESEADRPLPMHGANQWPAAYPTLKPNLLRYMDELTELAQKLMELVALGLTLPQDYFRRRFTNEPTALFRVFNYAKHVWKDEQDEWGVREHTDYGFLTILRQDDSGGLQVKTRAGAWIEAPPIKDTFVINLGDMLEVWTHGIYRSTPHRVRNQSGTDRISLPFFFDPNWNSTLEPIDRALLPTHLLQRVDSEVSKRWDGLNLAKLSRDLTYGSFIWEKVKKVFPGLTQL